MGLLITCILLLVFFFLEGILPKDKKFTVYFGMPFFLFVLMFCMSTNEYLKFGDTVTLILCFMLLQVLAYVFGGNKKIKLFQKPPINVEVVKEFSDNYVVVNITEIFNYTSISILMILGASYLASILIK